MSPLRQWLAATFARTPDRVAGWTWLGVCVLVLVYLWLLLVVLAMPAQASTTAEPMPPPAAAARYRAELTRAAQVQWGLDAPVAALAAQVHQESGWRPDAVSRVGAEGMAQFMPATARWWCELHRMSPADCQPRNPTWALRALAGYDKWLWDRIRDTAAECDRLAMTLSAYNGGLGWVQRDRALASSEGLDSSRYWGAVETVNAGRAAWAITENRDYPRRILLQHALRYAAWGRTPCAPESTGATP